MNFKALISSRAVESTIFETGECKAKKNCFLDISLGIKATVSNFRTVAAF